MSIERDYFELASNQARENHGVGNFSGVLRLNTRFQTFVDQGIDCVFVYPSGESLLYEGRQDWYMEGEYRIALMDPNLYEKVVNLVSGRNFQQVENGRRRLMPIAHVPGKTGDFPLVVQMMELNPDLIGWGLHGAYFELRNPHTFLRVDDDPDFIKTILEFRFGDEPAEVVLEESVEDPIQSVRSFPPELEEAAPFAVAYRRAQAKISRG